MSAVLKTQEPSARYLAAVRPGLVEHFDSVASAPRGVARLRELILTLAVRGKLMPQNSDDEPASVLLDRIRAEKNSLVASGKIKRERAAPPILADDLPHQLPARWKWVRLGTVTKKITDGTHRSPANFPQGDFKYLSAKNIKAWGVDLTDVTYVPASVHEEIYSRCDPEFGDILYIKDGATTGVLTINTLREQFSLLSSVGVIKPSCGLTSEYLALVLRSPFFYQAMRDGMTGVAITRVTLSKLAAALFPLPPLAEQSRIVARVGELMRLCDALEVKGRLEDAQHAQLLNTLLGTLTESASPEEFAANWQRVATHFDLLLDRPEAVDALEQTISQLAVRGLLVAQGADDEPACELVQTIGTERQIIGREGSRRREKELPVIGPGQQPFDLPRGWQWSNLGELTLWVTDGTHRTPRYLLEGVPFISVKDIDGKTVSFADCRFISEEEHRQINARCDPERGDILLCRIGTLGRPTIVDTDKRFSLFVSVGLLKMPKSVDISRYLHLVLSTPLLASQYNEIKAGGSHTNKLNLASIPMLKIPLPPLAEQARILERAGHLRRLCADLRAKLASARATQVRLADALVGAAASAD